MKAECYGGPIDGHQLDVSDARPLLCFPLPYSPRFAGASALEEELRGDFVLETIAVAEYWRTGSYTRDGDRRIYRFVRETKA